MKKLSDELMVGDIFATLSGKPRRVTHTTCSTLALSSWQIDAFNKPVPLDIPTLELNGFDFTNDVFYDKYTRRIVRDGDKYDVNITFDRNDNLACMFIWKISGNPERIVRSLSFSGILYVHQLQNLMRMCELADFANDFKVEGLDDNKCTNQ